MGSLEGMLASQPHLRWLQMQTLGKTKRKKKSIDFGSEFSWVGRDRGGRRHVGLVQGDKC